VRAPVDTIHAPPFPRALGWINVATLRMDKQRGRPVLIEFFDVCRVHSLRTLPYVQAWHERYEPDGLRVVSVHAPGYPPSFEEEVVRATLERFGVVHPVALDHEFNLWQDFGNEGWPARYLFTPEQRLLEFHYGQGAYDETERAIQELLGVERELVAPLRPQDALGADLVVPTADIAGPWSGPYEAGAVWAVLEGRGTIAVNGEERPVPWTGAHLLVEHERHAQSVLELELGPGVVCHGVQFEPGLAP
jgi:hypothetical protein